MHSNSGISKWNTNALGLLLNSPTHQTHTAFLNSTEALSHPYRVLHSTVTSILIQAVFLLFVSVFCYNSMFVYRHIFEQQGSEFICQNKMHACLNYYMDFTFLYTAVLETAKT